jgi:hypothetical protein
MKRLTAIVALFVCAIILVGANDTEVMRGIDGNIRAFLAEDGALVVASPSISIAHVYPVNGFDHFSSSKMPYVLTNNVPANVNIRGGSAKKRFDIVTFKLYSSRDSTTSEYYAKHTLPEKLEKGKSYTIVVKPRFDGTAINCGAVMNRNADNSCESTFRTKP